MAASITRCAEIASNGARRTAVQKKKGSCTRIAHLPRLKISDEMVYLDRRKLEKLRVAAGLSMSELKFALDNPSGHRGVSHNTVDKAFREEGIWPGNAKAIADFFERSVEELFAPHDPRYEPPAAITQGIEWEWEREAVLSPGIYQSSNGLHFLVYRMKHRYIPGRLGRGKLYLLSGLTLSEREETNARVKRHAEVCNRIGIHRNLAENESTTPVQGGEGWWIVDRWIDSHPLSDVLETRTIPPELLATLMKDIAAGLSALHRAEIVMRELAPSRVLITNDDGRALLTEFELAKLLGGDPTVAPDESWPEDPYRAPEVDSGEVTPAADLYSWARILVHAACGVCPPMGKDQDALMRLGLPKAIWGIARRCLHPAPSARPASIDEVLHAIRNW
jgi:serine/threonine protein kinase